MLINADIGEIVGSDEAILPYIKMGNIACGGHASDAGHMEVTVDLAIQYEVNICAHPGYCDRPNFGRISVDYCREELVKLVSDQIGLLDKICQDRGGELTAIKPHGALYHDMMRDKAGMVRTVMVEMARKYQVPLVVQAGSEIEWGIEVMTEVFADRGYMADGGLMPRTEECSLYDNVERIVEQARRFIDGDGVRTCNGGDFSLEADTICFHGDNLASVDALKLLNVVC